jgi:hypothetical protein
VTAQARGCALTAILFVGAAGGPPAVALMVGPSPGLVCAIGAVIAWSWLSPRPLPGLLPGLMAVTVIGVDAAVLVACAARLAGEVGEVYSPPF